MTINAKLLRLNIKQTPSADCLYFYSVWTPLAPRENKRRKINEWENQFAYFFITLYAVFTTVAASFEEAMTLSIK